VGFFYVDPVRRKRSPIEEDEHFSVRVVPTAPAPPPRPEIHPAGQRTDLLRPGLHRLPILKRKRVTAMARGFESKSVQSQWQDAEAREDERRKVRLDPETRERNRKRESLNLSRSRVVNDLAAATNPAHRATLEKALAHLDQELARLS
jgi:hypothetical protein